MRHKHVGQIKNYQHLEEPQSEVFAREFIDINADVIVTENIEDWIVICVFVTVRTEDVLFRLRRNVWQCFEQNLPR